MEKIQSVLLLKFGEVVLKGLNRRHFEAIMLRDIKSRLEKIGEYSVENAQSTVTVTPKNDEALEKLKEATDTLLKVFGIVAVSKAYETEKDMKKICELLPVCLYDELSAAKSFKVEARRSDKSFPLASPDICRECGGVILSKFPHLKVDVKNPELTVRVEIRDKAAYIHSGAIAGAGGMPQGSAGKGLLLLSGGIDSPVAGYMMAKRGVMINALHFESYPYTSEQAREKVIELAKLMQDRCGPMRLSIISVTHIQEELKRNCREEYFTLLLRRFMMRLAELSAVKCGAKCIITGESLGQVASQTMGAILTTNNAVGNIPVYRPLIAFDKEDIVKISRNIGTFETSILPYEDCCTVFTPKHPVTNPVLENILAEEEKVDVASLVDEAMKSAQTVTI